MSLFYKPVPYEKEFTKLNFENNSILKQEGTAHVEPLLGELARCI